MAVPRYEKRNFKSQIDPRYPVYLDLETWEV